MRKSLTGYVALKRGENLQLPYAGADGYKNISTPMISVNRIFRHHGHLFIYDFETLGLLLKRIGFVEIKQERFKTGRDPQMLIDSESRACESLYVEATKPAV